MLQEYNMEEEPECTGYSTPTTGNKVYFGTDLKLEWESIFINTL
jgi:hypothetical protein